MMHASYRVSSFIGIHKDTIITRNNSRDINIKYFTIIILVNMHTTT